MIKTIMCIRRKPGLSREEFEHHWKNIHAPLIQELKQDLRILRYVQSNANEDMVSTAIRQQRNGPEKFDGIGQAWFASLNDLIEVSSDPASAQALGALRQDELKFIDLDNSPMFVVEEETVFDDLSESGR
ncbi:EthD domain-containing protein [Emcibacter nanhaiensis]|uniref:EthD family reductase n=1 Tax=Emcibacter nanhaiensis TaxID=1505037 RepID=A0A501PJL2_9PROT|nr:EthD domain-containing protein [Emcibacter nanhaiensis]TPD60238.1 EthD family reductase [Emcibacter nanhaiensis]